MNQGIVVSDLHLLSWRSDGDDHFEDLAGQLREVQALVLNGDIFDFRWAIRPHSETVPEAIGWLESLRDRHPHLEIHFIPGNHDCIPAFVDAVKALDGITLHPHLCFLGRNLFLHGDAASYPMDQNGFRKFRAAWENDRPSRKSQARLYDLSDSLKLSELTHHLWFRGNVAVRRIEYHLEDAAPGWRDEIDHCYFGHTHMPVHGYEKDGVRFFNTGSAIRGMYFTPHHFTY
ncbi:MAG: metallophosphoesterase [Verrucomicrobiales bacterium]|nr:metallophosphoesterase [Verrucomicrobiales bacterium]